MKTKVKNKSFDEVNAIARPEHKKPLRPFFLLHLLVYLLSMWKTLWLGFRCERIGMEKLKKGEPCLILMNHSAFLDLKIAFRIFFPRPFTIVTTSDAFVGKRLLMRLLGCISTQKFVTDLTLLKDIRYSLQTLKCSVLMFPEAGYSLDGRTTTLPDSLGSFMKMMKVPVVSVRTNGVFSHDPLYNGLQERKVKPTAQVTYLLSPEEIAEKSASELNHILSEALRVDGFAWQEENKIKITEPFRADGLNRILFRCPHCGKEGGMEGKGIELTCHLCDAKWELSELGMLVARNHDARFTRVTEWYDWQKSEIAAEVASGEYRLDCEVDIALLIDTKAFYFVGSGRLTHDAQGFRLVGCDGKIDYLQKPSASYSVNADYYFYEIGDVISFGDRNTLYYCFPKNVGDVVAKTRIAAEEMYRLSRRQSRTTRSEKTE